MAVTVIPEQGNFPAIARALLDVADHPSQIQMVTYPASGFLVPDEVFERFEASRKTKGGQEKREPNRQDREDDGPPANDSEQQTEPRQEQETPAPRRRGRPRKVAPAQEE